MADIDDFDDEEERKRRSAASAPEFTYDTIAADVWTAVYYGIPLGAGPDLLRHAYDAAMQCAGAVAGPPGLSMHAFAPMQGELGADKSREENFEHAVRRLDELNSRLRPAILDDEAERQAVPEQQPTAEKEPMTVETIERDTWNAVDLDIPADADRAFLATVALAAEHCEKFAVAAGRVGEVMEPELVEFYQERQTAASDRRDEAWRQFTVRAPEQGSETRLLNPEQMQDRAMSSLHEQAHEHRETAGQGAEITHEALDKNPWVVLTGVLAELDNRALLDRIDGTLHELRDEATQRRAAAGSPEEAELWRVVAGDAESRGREAREEIANLTARESAGEISRAAEKEPMTIEAIERDPRNAVDLDIPPDASRELLTLVATTAENMRGATNESIDDLSAKEVAELSALSEAAEARRDEALLALDRRAMREAANAPEFSRETIAADPWTTVYLPIPQAADEGLLRHAHGMAMQCCGAVAGPAERLSFDAFWPSEGGLGADKTREENFEHAVRRLDELHARRAEAMTERHRDEYELVHGAYGVEELPSQLAVRHEQELGDLQESRDAGDEISRPLSAAERNERVRRIIENPHLEGAERDDGVLQALAEQREELGLAEPARQDDDTPQVEYSQEPELQSTADRDAAEVDYLFGREEMTEARAAAYDRFTGQELSPRTGQSAGPVHEAGQSQSHSKGRSR